MNPKNLACSLVAALLLATASPAAIAGQENGRPQADGKEVVTPSGVRYTDLKIGEGAEAAAGKIIEVHYIGRLEDGTKFDANPDRERPFTFRLGTGDVIKGWDEGIAGMKVGGKRKVVIPPELGFGKQGVGSVVPPNAVLFYEFELVAVR
jgi:FKBP-type peptidyl-prolyl cis-trans isomerase